MTSRDASPSRHTRALAGVAALSLGGFAMVGPGTWRPASVYASGAYARSFALACTGAPVTDDTGLQAAVTNAVDGTVICIAQSITLSRTLVLDDTTVTLVGDDSTVALTAPANFRHIQATSSTAGDDTLTVLDLTVRDGVVGYMDTGGAIDSSRVHVIVQRSLFINNRADRLGGAISVDGAGVSATETDFIGNETNGSPSTGGAIEADGTVVIQGGLFSGNQSADSGGAVSSPTAIQVTGATFSDNTAGRAGGAVELRGNGSIDLTDTTFSRNAANSSGGAVYAGFGTTGLTASNTRFEANTAVTGYGGAIYFAGPGTVEINDGIFSDNVAFSSGGAIYSYEGDVSVAYTSFVRNRAIYNDGGAILVQNGGGSISAVNSTFYGNSSADSGGAAYAHGDLTLQFVTSIDDSALGGQTAFATFGNPLTIVGSVISPAVGTSSCDAPADNASYDSFVTDASCGSGDDTVNTGYSNRMQLGLADSITADDSVLIPGPTSVLIGAAPFDLVLGVTLDQLRATRGPVTTTVGAVQVSSAPPSPTPGNPPGAPGQPTASAGNRSSEVSWSPPASVGSFPITTYQVVNDVDGATCLLSVEPETPLTCEVTGLANGATYRFRVRALNGAGWGPWSSWSPPVTPEAPSIAITGSRDGRLVRISGITTGLTTGQVIPRIRVQGQDRFRTGKPRTLDAQGCFTWKRTTVKKITVFFIADGIRSNRVVIARDR